jgi:hypothetical protein
VRRQKAEGNSEKAKGKGLNYAEASKSRHESNPKCHPDADQDLMHRILHKIGSFQEKVPDTEILK